MLARRMVVVVLASLCSMAGGLLLQAPAALALDVHAPSKSFDPFGSAVVPDLGTEPPEVSTEQASNVQPTSATLHGTVNPQGVELSTCQFEYFGYETGVHTVACEQSPKTIGSGTAPVSVSAEATGLQEDKSYNFRLEATNPNAAQGQYLEFTTPGPPRVAVETATHLSHTKATLGALVSPEGFETTYDFEYGTTTSYGTSIPVPAASVGSGTSYLEVSQELSGLQAETTYDYRIVATNSRGTVDGEPATFTTPPPVTFGGTSAANIGTTTATLYASLNPLGTDTTYHFEYGTTTSYGNSAPASPADIGSGEGEVIVSQAVSGLQENTVYHFRVVGTNSIGTSDGPDEIFMTRISPSQCPNAAGRTGPSAHLPDCRAYELVTPPNKREASQDLIFDINAGFSQAAVAGADGDHIAVKLGGVTFGPNPLPNGTFAVFSRGATGWEITAVNPPGSDSEIYNEGLFNSDLTEAAVTHESTPLTSTTTEIFSVGPDGAPPSSILATLPQGNGTRFSAGSTDLSKIIVESPLHNLLHGGAPTGTDAGANDLYQWSNGQFSLVNVTTAGTLVSQCGASQTSTNASWSSTDGSKIFFQSPETFAPSGEPGCEEPTQVYVRLNGKETVDVSTPEAGLVNTKPVYFSGASADGSEVLLTSEGQLTADAAGRYGMKLYLYDAATGKLSFVTASLTGSAEAAEILISEDGSSVFFRDGENETYYRYDTSTGTLQFIAQREVEASYGGNKYESIDTTTANGKVFLFVAQRVAGIPLRDGGSYNDEVYRFDAENSNLVCVSCPSDLGEVHGGGKYFPLSGILETPNHVPRPLAMSSDGSYVFFDSNDHLVPQDTNAAHGGNYTEEGTDVYEWHNGTVSLITAGNSPQPSTFLGTSPDGSNVFFATHSQLVPQDTDTLGDIYDARIDGGFPVATEPVPCQGDACHNPPPLPNDATPSSMTFSGPGNPTPAGAAPVTVPKSKQKQCKKGTVRKKGKCVKKGKAKQAKAKKAKAKKARAKKAAYRAVKHNRGGSK